MKISKENIYDLVRVTLLNAQSVVLKGVTFSVSNKDFDQGVTVVFEWGSEVAIYHKYIEKDEAGTLEVTRSEPKTPSSTGLDIKMKNEMENEIYGLLKVTLLNSQDEDLYGMTLFVTVEEFEQGITVVKDWGSEVKVLTEGEAGSCEATPLVRCEPKPSSTGPLMKDWGSEVKVLTEGEAGSCEATPLVRCEPKPSSTGPLMKVGRPAIYQILMAAMIAYLLVYYGEMEERVEVDAGYERLELDAGYGEMEERVVADAGYGEMEERIEACFGYFN